MRSGPTMAVPAGDAPLVKATSMQISCLPPNCSGGKPRFGSHGMDNGGTSVLKLLWNMGTRMDSIEIS
jgi:hypothetical protein